MSSRQTESWYVRQSVSTEIGIQQSNEADRNIAKFVLSESIAAAYSQRLTLVESGETI
jgi:hypothetical protein